MISTLATLRYRGAHFGRIYGLIGISVGLGGFLGAWIGGLLHDWTHGYTALMIARTGAGIPRPSLVRRGVLALRGGRHSTAGTRSMLRIFSLRGGADRRSATSRDAAS
jgi:hypothetical protein